ncbi:glycosyltransferase family 2 protein [Nodosilinea nodulosa]|uniref:glycosyltransferase family 2 protein n=1 Tax=Nodosilinea nodulosa TaxID=416001 RepID=UPI0002F519D2|nr:glycosyltransferase family 2 protein [Nodosilinea nodulosa]
MLQYASYRSVKRLDEQGIVFGGTRFSQGPMMAIGDSPLVSILTIVLNAEDTLESTIKNVLSQSYSPIEHIVVDGGSRDRTLDIIKEYEDRIDCWISSTDINTSDAMNKAIALANGALIGMISAGDWYEKDAIAQVVEAHRRNPEAIVHGNCQYWSEDLKPRYIMTARDDTTKFLHINHLAAFTPKTVYQRVGIFDLNFGQANDYEWYLRNKLKGTKFHYLDQVITHMRLGGMSDHNWLLNYHEGTRARVLHGEKPLISYARLAVMVVKTLVRKGLEAFGLNRLVKIYQTKLAAVRKAPYL